VLLGFLAMEPPNSFGSVAVRDEINKVLDAVHPLTPEEVLIHAVRGQYGEGVMPSASGSRPTDHPPGWPRTRAPRPMRP
jgi:glucose-6-phosphate 1-dehydrogenase